MTATTDARAHDRSPTHDDAPAHDHDHDSPAHDHDHGHAHDHDHDHAHAHDQPEAGQAPQGGPVMLDIGDDVGALLAFMDAELIGTELHVRRLDEARTTHTGVWERDLGPRRVVVAVFPALREGVYDVLGANGAPTRSVTIAGGGVVELDLRTP